MTRFKHELGIKVRDKITGFTGIITARTEYLFGCARYLVEPQVKGDGSMINSQTFDEDSLSEIEERPPVEREQVEKPQKWKTGGPRESPTRPPIQRR